jgi:hypothetical protein
VKGVKHTIDNGDRYKLVAPIRVPPRVPVDNLFGPPLQEVVEFQAVTTGFKPRIDFSYSPTTVLQASVTVVDATSFSASNQIQIGPHTLLPWLHWTPVIGNVNNSALGLATGISRLPDFKAVAVGAVVTITYNGGADDLVHFKVVESGTTRFGGATPSNGFFAQV